MPDTVEISFSLRCTIKKEREDRWVAGCPMLDVYSQGSSREDAKRSLEEAVGAWVESCLERSTLDEALRELTFQRVHPAEIRSEDQHISVDALPETAPDDTFPIHLSVPAFQAVAVTGST